ncbi:Tetratricopeptide TPR_1 repeat-containing protein (plasmid) [Granulicella tundricola MP5ACTX9]|uniref:Tetratricopeptide TPR_1 repeat-containing protein n=2 Tax=Granulicella TaxID=940557 RepID=E8X6H9_GRATM|nr:Tetratricopeptide TPR_1 repeat-containing protein [Granulicella tundricola MP5ACTX9]
MLTAIAVSQAQIKPKPADLAAASTAMQQGIAAANRNDLPAAAAAFVRATQLVPTLEPPQAALGSILLAQGDLPAAARTLARAHTLDPNDLATTLNLARTLTAQADYPTALPLFHQALTSPNPPALSPEESLAYATTLSATGNPTEAQSQLTQALTATPDSALLHDALGVLLVQSRHLPEAVPHFERATQLDPAYTQAQLHLGTTLLLLGQPDQAIPPLRKAATQAPTSFDAHLQLGRALSAARQDQPALTELHRAAELRTPATPPAAIYDLALALEASGDSASSLPLFAASAHALGSSEALINYALARVQTGDAIGALPLYAKAVTLGPDSATLREDYGVAYLQQSDLDHAITQFRAGLALDPQSPHLHYDLGLAFKLKDDLPASITELQLASTLDPTLPDPAYTLGVIYMQQGRYPDAIAQLRRATTLQPTNGDAWALLGGVLKDSDDTPAGAQQAIEALRHASALQPDQPSLHIQIAALLIRTNQPEQAAAERKTAAELSRAAVAQQRASFSLRSGRTLLAQGKLPEAIVQLNAAIAADPKAPEPHTLLAEALTRQGKPAEAAIERQRALTLKTP